MKPYLWMPVTAGSCAVLILLAASLFTSHAVPPQAVDSTAVTLPEEPTKATDYILRIDGKNLVVFRGDEPEPYQRLNIELSLLREQELSQLRQGIHVQSEAELRALLEDFTS